MLMSYFKRNLFTLCGIATVSAIASVSVLEAGAAHAGGFSQTQTRTETELFGNETTFPNNNFRFEIPALVSNALDFTISWQDLDLDGRDEGTPPNGGDEVFDVVFFDQQGTRSRIFNNIDSNLGGNRRNSSGTHSTILTLPSLDGGTLRFRVRAGTGADNNGINRFLGQEGSLTLAVSGDAVPTPALLPGLLTMGAVALRKQKNKAADQEAQGNPCNLDLGPLIADKVLNPTAPYLRNSDFITLANSLASLKKSVNKDRIYTDS